MLASMDMKPSSSVDEDDTQGSVCVPMDDMGLGFKTSKSSSMSSIISEVCEEEHIQCVYCMSSMALPRLLHALHAHLTSILALNLNFSTSSDMVTRQMAIWPIGIAINVISGAGEL